MKLKVTVIAAVRQTARASAFFSLQAALSINAASCTNGDARMGGFTSQEE
jgi:hypothetical protein